MLQVRKMNPTNIIFTIIAERMLEYFYTLVYMYYGLVKKATYIIMFGCVPLSNKLIHALVGNKLKGYHIAVWNCARGLILPDCSTSDKFVDIKLHLQKHQLDIFGVLECDLHSDESRLIRKSKLTTSEAMSKLYIEGYKLILPLSWQQHGLARVILYVKESINVGVIRLSNSDSDLATISVEISKGNEKKTNINIFYREFTGGVTGFSDSNAQKDRLERQINHWKSLFRSGRDVVIQGDSNLCETQWTNESYQFRDLVKLMDDFLLETSSFQLVKEYTRSQLVANVIQRSIIDHCYTQAPEKVIGPFIETVGNSDHLGVRITKTCKNNHEKPQVIRKRCYKRFNIEDFLTDVLHSDINSIITAQNDLETAAELFEYEFCAILDFHAPIKTIQIRNNYCPYLSEETKIEIANRNALKKAATKTGDPLLLREYKNKVKSVKKAVKNDKKQAEILSLHSNVSAKTAWSMANQILGVKKSLAPRLLLYPDESKGTTSNPLDIASILNDFFLNKVKSLRNKSLQEPVGDPISRLSDWLRKRDTPIRPFKITNIDIKMLRIFIKKMKGGRSCGSDNIDSYSLKLAAPLVEDALLHIINLSINHHKFANRWKQQLIFPQHKKGDKLRSINYRPVSHLVEIGQLVERVVQTQILGHFLKNDLFHPNQHGGLPKHSTCTALLQIYDILLKNAEDRKITGTLLLDQTAAYDLLDHKIFLHKLQLYGFDKESIGWISSYLSDRTQCVQVQSKRSCNKPIGDFGIPQGSILGGLFFIINENDFADCRENGQSVLFVDDDTDLIGGNSKEDLSAQLQAEANKSCAWLKDNYMVVAGEKSDLLVVGTAANRRIKLDDQPVSIVVDGKRVTESESKKLLGVFLNNSLTWKNHTESLITELSRRAGLLQKLSYSSSKKKLKMFTYGIFYSKLEYCLPLFINTWGLDPYSENDDKYVTMTKNQCRKIQIIQNKVCRLFLPRIEQENSRIRKQDVSTADLLKRNNVLSVHQLGAHSTIMLAKKIITDRKPQYLADQFQVSNETNTRNRTHLMLPKVSLSASREGFVYRAIKLVNMLPTSLWKEESMQSFKEKLREWIKSNIRIKP